MRYVIKSLTKPDTVFNSNVAPGTDKLAWISPYAGIRTTIEESIAKGYASRYYTELDTLTVDPDTGNQTLTREYLSLEGAQHMKAFLDSTLTVTDCKILDVWIETIADDGTVTRLP